MIEGIEKIEGFGFGAKEKAARWGAALEAGVAFRRFGRKDRFDRRDRADRRNRGDRWNFGAIPSGFLAGF